MLRTRKQTGGSTHMNAGSVSGSSSSPAPKVGGFNCNLAAQTQRGGRGGRGGRGRRARRTQRSQRTRRNQRRQSRRSHAQRGGMISSHPVGYGFGPQGVVSTPSAHYLDVMGYTQSCQGGGRRK